MGLPTRADYFNLGAEEVVARSLARPPSQRIARDAIFTEGTDINVILASAAGMADEVTRHLALRCGALYLDSAEKNDLDRLVEDRFGPTVQRKQPAPALVPLQFSRPNPSGGSVILDRRTFCACLDRARLDSPSVILLRLEPGADVDETTRAIASHLPDDTVVWTRAELARHERRSSASGSLPADSNAFPKL